MKKLFPILFFVITAWLPQEAISQRYVNSFNARQTNFDADYQNLLNNAALRNYGLPSLAVQIAGNQLVLDLKSAGIWAKAGHMKVMYSDGPAFFTDLNWINPDVAPSTRVGTPPYGQKTGVTFNGTSTYTDMGTKLTAVPNYSLNSAEQIIDFGAAFGGFSNAKAQGARDAGSTNVSALVPVAASGQTIAATNVNSLPTLSDAQFDLTAGLYFWGRTASNSQFAKKNSGTRVTSATTSSAIPSLENVAIGALNTGGTVGAFQDCNVYLYWAGGVLSTTDEANFITAWNTYKASVLAAAAIPTIGTIYNKSSWSDLSDFTVDGATASVVSNQIVFAGASGSLVFTQTIDLPHYTMLDKHTSTIQFVATNKNATSFGVSVGVRSNNSNSVFNSLLARFDGSTDANSGKIQIYSSGFALTSTSVSALTFSAGDMLSMTCTWFEGTYSASAYNVSTFSSPITISTTNYTGPNIGRFAIWDHGGGYKISSYTVTSSEFTHPQLAAVGDSKTQQLSASTVYKSYGYILNQYNMSTTVIGGSSDGSADYLNQVWEIINLIKPNTVLLAGFVNEIVYSVPSGTWQANITSLVSQLQAAGIRVYISTGLYETLDDQSTIRTWILANYPSSMIIDSVNTTLGLNADNRHPNDAGHLTYAGIIRAAGLITH